MEKYLYLTVDLASFAVPFIFSFEKKWLHFIGRWKAILAGLVIMASFFLIWDVMFTSKGVWGFNDRYLLGVNWLGLPMEEYLFFFLIGFCCLFVYESLNHLIKIPIPELYFKYFFLLLGLINLLVAVLNKDKAYTFSALGLNGLLILIFILWHKSWSWKKFFLGYGFSFIPFSIVNGILTGGFTPEPVVWYNPAENLGIRMDTIPIEDSQYMMLMMLISVAVYNYVWYSSPLSNRNAESSNQLN